MNLDALLKEISEAETGDQLRVLEFDAKRGDWTREQKEQIQARINLQFCKINAKAVGPQKARW